MIAHYDEEDKKSGEWLITARGGQFLRVEISVPAKVLIFRNQVKDHAKELVHINHFRFEVPAFQKDFAYEEPRIAVKRSEQPSLFIAA